MKPSLDPARCDFGQLECYVDGSLDQAAAQVVEDHLTSCPVCRERLESNHADWQRTQELLRWDELDAQSATLNYSPVDANEVLPNNETAMLSREICGWLDPTDDPQMLGRFAGYEIVGVIGHGGMGIVLKGVEQSLNRFVAIKVLAPRLATNGTARKRFSREARAAAAVLHENVIAIHRVDEWHGLPFLVMPYVGGASLQKRIDNEGPLSVEAAMRVGVQIAAGLAAAHEKGLIHRDIKPANILLDHGVERVTITDFGLARAADDASMTRTGVIAGTPQYMSPEQAGAKAMDGRSDLFSLGSVLYTMVCGHPPFRGDGSFEVLKRVGNEQARPPHEIDAAIPVWFDNLVERLHAKSADDRPRSAAEVQRLLTGCLLHLTQPGQPLPIELTMRPIWRWKLKISPTRSTSALICIVLAVVAIATPIALLKGTPQLPWLLIGATFAFAAAFLAAASWRVFAMIGVSVVLWSGMILISRMSEMRNELNDLRHRESVLPANLPHLKIGKSCPNIQASDLDGNQMSLADNQGKVVLLVFWASWCGPCMGDVAHEKEIVERFQGRPFELIGVNGDKSLDDARVAVAEHAIPWRSFWNGGSDGPITREWGLQAWPTIYVIDDLGIIRHKNLRGRRLDTPLERLVSDAELRARNKKQGEHESGSVEAGDRQS